MLAGFLWQSIGSAATFLCGAAFAGIALAGLIALSWRGASAQRGRR
jgi:hypothetical protein